MAEEGFSLEEERGSRETRRNGERGLQCPLKL